MLDLSDFTAADILAAAEEDPVIAQWLEAELEPKGLRTFVPRPNRPEAFDEQEAFCNARRRPDEYLLARKCLGCHDRRRLPDGTIPALLATASTAQHAVSDRIQYHRPDL